MTRARGLLLAAALVSIRPGLVQASSWEVDDMKPGVGQTLERFKQADSGVAHLLQSAAGYAVFRRVGKFGLVIGGARGDGLVYEGGVVVGLQRVMQVTIGAQAGAQVYSELVLFQNQATLERFKQGRFELSAQANAIVVGEDGVRRDVSYDQGTVTFVLPVRGRLLEASIGGQRIAFRPLSEMVASVAPPPPPPPPPVTQRRGG